MSVRIDVKEGGRLRASFDLDPQLISVDSLKGLIEAETGMAAGEQRLVYRGRTLKDAEPLSSYIQGGPAVLFLAYIGDDSSRLYTRIPAALSPSMPSKEAMLGPLASIISKNPEMLEKMFMSNPQVQAMVEKHPQLKHALSDPKTLQDMFNMSTNKAYYQEAMRGHDRALSNLENIPQGFQHLVQMQKSISDAEGMRGGMSPPMVSRASPPGITQSQPQREIVREPFPNPWEPAKKPKTTQTPTTMPTNSQQWNDFPPQAAAIRQRMELLKRLEEQRLDDLDLPTEYSDSDMDDEDEGDILDLGKVKIQSPSPQPAEPGDVSHYAARYHKELKFMAQMGFTDEQ